MVLGWIRKLAKANAFALLVGVWLVGVFDSAALAQTACTSPVVCVDGTVSAPTALVGTQTQYGVAVGGTSQTLAFIATDASTTKYLKSGGSSANPTWSTIATGDLPSNVMLETENANLLGSGAATNGQVLQANGSGGTTWATPSTGAVPVLVIESESPISAGAGTVYMSLSGKLSTTEATVRSSIKSAATFGNLACHTTVSPAGTSFVVTLGDGACTSAATYGTVSVTPITANTQVSTTNTEAVSAGTCAVLKIVKTGSTVETGLRCSLERTA